MTELTNLVSASG